MAEYICPHCNQPIYDDEALLCLYCGESLQRHGIHSGDRRKILIIVIAVTVLISFVLLAVR